MEPEPSYLAFEQLKARLQKEGLFDPKHKKELPPAAPDRLVTSPTGRLSDLMKIIQRRWPGLHLCPCTRAGSGGHSSPAIARAIDLLNRVGGIELIIVGRGGGSLEEIWAFNTEIVARSIFRSTVPVISAVGHETDFTISDFCGRYAGFDTLSRRRAGLFPTSGKWHAGL